MTSKLQGYTLIELLIVLVLVMSLALLGLFSTSHLVQRNEKQIIINELKTVIQFSKLQAIRRGHSVFLSPIVSGNWSDGVILTQSQDLENPLYQWQWHHPYWKITWSGIYSPNTIVFSNNPVHAISNGHFVLFHYSTQEQITLVLNRLGRIKVS